VCVSDQVDTAASAASSLAAVHRTIAARSVGSGRIGRGRAGIVEARALAAVLIASAGIVAAAAMLDVSLEAGAFHANAAAAVLRPRAGRVAGTAGGGAVQVEGIDRIAVAVLIERVAPLPARTPADTDRCRIAG
jgi:hypothetical protein